MQIYRQQKRVAIGTAARKIGQSIVSVGYTVPPVGTSVLPGTLLLSPSLVGRTTTHREVAAKEKAKGIDWKWVVAVALAGFLDQRRICVIGGHGADGSETAWTVCSSVPVVGLGKARQCKCRRTVQKQIGATFSTEDKGDREIFLLTIAFQQQGERIQISSQAEYSVHSLGSHWNPEAEKRKLWLKQAQDARGQVLYCT
jgi:hypothetical protein